MLQIESNINEQDFTGISQQSKMPDYLYPSGKKGPMIIFREMPTFTYVFILFYDTQASFGRVNVKEPCSLVEIDFLHNLQLVVI